MVTSRLQFWILLSGSIFIVLLLLIQGLLLSSVQAEGRLLVKNREIVASGSSYETQWKQLAARAYELGRQDGALTDILTRNQIVVRPSAATSSPAVVSPSGAAAPTSKTPQVHTSAAPATHASSMAP
jgi:hypothetical protein